MGGDGTGTPGDVRAGTTFDCQRLGRGLSEGFHRQNRWMQYLRNLRVGRLLKGGL
jgi:hypothetical protein